MKSRPSLFPNLQGVSLFELARMADATIAPAVEDATVDAHAAATGKQDINPWSVSGEVGEDGKVKAIDYRKLIDEFGTSLIDDALLERWERVTGSKPHRFMRRGIVFSHRDLTAILDRYEKVREEIYESGRALGR